MHPNKTLIVKISTIGDKFFDNHQDTIFEQAYKENKHLYLENWWLASQLLIKHLFLRGRKDQVSIAFYKIFIRFATTNFGISTNNWDFSDFKNTIARESQSSLLEKLEATGLNNPLDREMIYSVIQFIKEVENPVKWVIESHNLKNTYDRLRKIVGVGDKLASFFLRNIYRLFDLEKRIVASNDQESMLYLLPVDTWIGKICYLTGITGQISGKTGQAIIAKYANTGKELTFSSDEEPSGSEKPSKQLTETEKLELKKAMIKICLDLDKNPMSFNQGAWSVGFYSLPLLLSLLENKAVDGISFDYKLPI